MPCVLNNTQPGKGLQGIRDDNRRPMVFHQPNGPVGVQGIHNGRPEVLTHAGARGVQEINGRPGVLVDSGRKGINGKDPANIGCECHPAHHPTDGSRLEPAFQALAERLANCYVLNKDWSTLMSASVLGLAPSDLKRANPPITGVFFDPPYATDGRKDLYRIDDRVIAQGVQKEALRLVREYPQCRVAVCSYQGDDLDPWPEDWSEYIWRTCQIRMAGKEPVKYDRTEVVWFSPNCLDPEEGRKQGSFWD